MHLRDLGKYQLSLVFSYRLIPVCSIRVAFLVLVAHFLPVSTVLAEDFSCIIEPQQIVNLSSSVEGIIGRLDVDRGDVVNEGQIVGKIQDDVEVAALDLALARAKNNFPVQAAEARLRYLKSQFERYAQLQSKNVTSRAVMQKATEDAAVAEHEFEEAKLNKHIAELQVRQAEAILDQHILRSPIDGVVVERLLLPGEYRNEQSPILKLAQIDPLRVEVFIPTAYYGQINVGDVADVLPVDPVGGAFKASVVIVDQVLDAASGTFGVRLQLPNPDLELPAGIRCEITFNLQ